MKDSKYRWILYTIVLVIIATIGIQVYWNYKNYETNKQQLANDVQTSLDKAVDDYYANLAEETTMGLSLSGSRQKDIFEEGGLLEQITGQIDEGNQTFSKVDFSSDTLDGVTIIRGFKVDSMMAKHEKEHKSISIDSFSAQIKTLKKENDSIDFPDFEMLTSKVVISITNDTLNIKKVDSLLKIELSRKNIFSTYDLHYLDGKKNSLKETKDLKSTIEKSDGARLLTTFSKSTFLPKNSLLGITYANQTQVVLKRILGGILLSFLLVLTVISCLFYLLKIIKHQKQLAEVKNDLISNITHEFKTPIATIGVALESIKDFNVIDDKEKTKNYLNMSSDQLTKLNTMVEKLLETATLDSNSVNLNKEEINLVDFIQNAIKRNTVLLNEKRIVFNHSQDLIPAHIDTFHFDNAINNIIDNAIKYGGKEIYIDLKRLKNKIELSISDNGNTLKKIHKDKIFEQFYRVPKGNKHDVKGFGIGLYYTKTIIKKHQGTIALELSNKKTTFKITLPNE